MPWLTAVQRQEEGIAAGKFGRCGKMVIKPYEIKDEHRERILQEFLMNIRLSICGCWEWQGRIHNGYACCYTPEGTKWGHRVSYALFNGPIKEQMHIDHKCRNTTCVNPGHLIQVTPVENYLAIQRRRLRDIKRIQEERGQLTIFNLIGERT